MKMEKFLKVLRDDDFRIGDMFWLGDCEFEVVGKRGPNTVIADDGEPKTIVKLPARIPR